MKIGIITYHFARNYGALLQCYALQKYLTEMGHDVQVLNYESILQERNNSMHHKRGNPIRNIGVNLSLLPFENGRRTKERKYRLFETIYLPLSKRMRTVDELRDYICQEAFDLIISGSDQVFNPCIDDFDIAFLFPFQTPARKASFAASLGSATLKNLTAYTNEIRQFDVLSVREQSDVPVIEQLCGRKPCVVGDPIFLLEKEAWSKLAAESSTTNSHSYVLGYFISKKDTPHYRKYLDIVSQELGLPIQVINVRFGLDSFKSDTIIDVGPLDFLQLFSNAAFICTDSFHGTAFSLIFNKPFFSLEPSPNVLDRRKLDLLEKVGESWRSVSIGYADINQIARDSATFLAPSVSEGLKSIQGNQIEFLHSLIGEA